jgi:hypothetical protein
MQPDFGATAQDYVRHRAGFPDSLFDRLSGFGIGKPGQPVVDLGTGTGTVARGFARRGCRVGWESILPNRCSSRYDVAVPYTPEGWRGRIRASAGVGASLPQEKVLEFDKALAHLLATRFPGEILEIPHRVRGDRACASRGPRGARGAARLNAV